MKRPIQMVPLVFLSFLGCGDVPDLGPTEIDLALELDSTQGGATDGGMPATPVTGPVSADETDLTLVVTAPGIPSNYQLIVETIGPVAAVGGGQRAADGGVRVHSTSWGSASEVRRIPLQITSLEGGAATIRVSLGRVTREIGLRIVPPTFDIDVCVAEIDCPEPPAEPLEPTVGSHLTFQFSVPALAGDVMAQRTLSLSATGSLALEDASPVSFDPRHRLSLTRGARITGPGFGELIARVDGLAMGRWSVLATSSTLGIDICVVGEDCGDPDPPAPYLGDRLALRLTVPELPARSDWELRLEASGSLSGSAETIALPDTGQQTVTRTFEVTAAGYGVVTARIGDVAEGRFEISGAGATRYQVLETVALGLSGTSSRNRISICSSLPSGQVAVTPSEGTVSPSSPTLALASAECPEGFPTTLTFEWVGKTSPVRFTLRPPGGTLSSSTEVSTLGLVEMVAVTASPTPWVTTDEGATYASRVDLQFLATVSGSTSPEPIATETFHAEPSPDVDVTPAGGGSLTTDLAGRASIVVSMPAALTTTELPLEIGGFRRSITLTRP